MLSGQSKHGIIFLVTAILLLFITIHSASAFPVDIESVEINGESPEEGITVEMGTTIHVFVEFDVEEEIEEAGIDVWLMHGSERIVHKSIELSDLEEGSTVHRHIYLYVPDDIESGDYEIKIMIEADDETDSYTYHVEIVDEDETGVPVVIESVTLDNVEIGEGTNDVRIRQGGSVPLCIRFYPTEDIESLRIESSITGTNSVSSIALSDLDADEPILKCMDLALRSIDDEYRITLEFSDNEDTLRLSYNVRITGKESGVAIKAMSVNPATVKTGRTLGIGVYVENTGDDSDDIRLTVRIPEMEKEMKTVISGLEGGEGEYSDFLFRVACSAEEGTYTVVVIAESLSSQSRDIAEKGFTIADNPECSSVDTGEKEIYIKDTYTSTVPLGGRALFPIELKNSENVGRSYFLEVSGIGSWAGYEFDPGYYILLGPGEQKTVNLVVMPTADAETGIYNFSVTVTSSGKIVRVEEFTINIVGGYSGTGLLPVTGNFIMSRTGLSRERINETFVVAIVTLVVITFSVIYALRYTNGNGNGRNIRNRDNDNSRNTESNNSHSSSQQKEESNGPAQI